MAIIVCFIFALLFLGLFLGGAGVNVLWNPTKPGTSGSMRLFGGLCLISAGLGVVYGWVELVTWLLENLK